MFTKKSNIAFDSGSVFELGKCDDFWGGKLELQRVRPALLPFFLVATNFCKKQKGCDYQDRLRTTACKCTREASKKRMSCNLARFPRRARARMVMIRAMSTRLFHALFCLTRSTFRGEAACRAATSLDRKFASFPRSLVATMVGCQTYCE